MVIKVNEYMEGKVKSLGAEFKGERFTAGVMLPGQYRFKTDQEEHITLTVGELNIRLPSENWKKASQGETVIVPSGVGFDLRIDETLSYICFYK
jgi:purine/pyrimidine-nucleoside phosphorylase